MRIPSDAVGFDFDGVIADIGEAFIRLACDNHNFCDFTLEDITDFHVEKCTNVPEIIVQQIFSEILRDSLATGLIPLPGAIEGLSTLTSLGKVTIITARTEAAPVVDWLQHYLPSQECRRINVIAMADHDLKVRFIKQENLRFFIDDRPQTCAMVAEAGLSPILFRQPWNSSWNDFFSIGSWAEIVELLERKHTQHHKP